MPPLAVLEPWSHRAVWAVAGKPSPWVWTLNCERLKGAQAWALWHQWNQIKAGLYVIAPRWSSLSVALIPTSEEEIINKPTFNNHQFFLKNDTEPGRDSKQLQSDPGHPGPAEHSLSIGPRMRWFLTLSTTQERPTHKTSKMVFQPTLWKQSGTAEKG